MNSFSWFKQDFYADDFHGDAQRCSTQQLSNIRLVCLCVFSYFSNFQPSMFMLVLSPLICKLNSYITEKNRNFQERTTSSFIPQIHPIQYPNALSCCNKCLLTDQRPVFFWVPYPMSSLLSWGLTLHSASSF